MPNSMEVDLIVKAISEGFEKVSADLQKTGGSAEQAGEGAESAGSSFTELASKLELAQKAAGIFFGTFQKAFELGQAGAQVTQTAESFDLLLQKVGAAPDLLSQLQEASRGTVDDMKLMSATSTLLAGTQGDLAKALADSTPQLMEIAKAAQKLNPSLGDTTFLYESLATGIKRASPLILDNLGLTISIEKAYADYALTLGKTAEALTAEEQKMALLTATLETGKTMIDQVGGSTESATDSIARMETAIKNTSDALKAQLAPSISNAADAIYYFLEGQNKIADALKEHTAHMGKAAEGWEEYKTEINRAYESVGYMVDITGDVIKVFKVEGDAITDVTGDFSLLSKATFGARNESSEATKAAEKLAATNAQLAKDTADAAKSNTGMANSMHLSKAAMEGALDAMSGADEALKQLQESQDALTVTTEALAAGLAGVLQDALETYRDTMGELIEEQAALNTELQTALNQGYSPTSEKVQELNAALEENNAKQQEAAEALAKATAEMIYQQAAAGLDAEAALALANNMGLISEADYAVAAAIAQLKTAYDANRDGAISAEEAAKGYTSSVELVWLAVKKLQESNTPITFDNLKKAMEDLATAAGSQDAKDGMEIVGGIAIAVGETGDEADQAADPIDDTATSMEKLGYNADSAIDPVNNLGDAIARLPKSINLRFSQTGGSDVLKLIHDIRDGIAELPAKKTVTIDVIAQEEQLNSPPPDLLNRLNGGGGGPANQTNVYNEFNVYDQMAGELLLEQERAAQAGRAEEMMNGR